MQDKERHPVFGDIRGWSKRRLIAAWAVYIPLAAGVLWAGAKLFSYLTAGY